MKYNIYRSPIQNAIDGFNIENGSNIKTKKEYLKRNIPYNQEDEGIRALYLRADYEDYLESNKNPTIFPENMELIEDIFNARYEIENHEFIIPNDYGAIYFAFPEKCKINGIELRPCIFGGVELEDGNYINIFTTDQNTKYGYGLSAALPKKKAMESLEGCAGNLSDMCKIHYIICARLLYYYESFPDCCQNEMPVDYNRKWLKKKNQPTVIGIKELKGRKLYRDVTKNPVSLHIRVGHWRYFKNPKFKKEKTWVRASFVGGYVDPNTLYAQ